MMNVHIKKLEEASTSYYAGNPIMTDQEFDTAVAQLRKNEPDHPFLKLVGAPVPGTCKVKHAIPMGSLSNANNEKEFRAWIPEYRRICLSDKLDGSSLELVYENGHFVRAITRGDGEVGEDVTRNVVLSPHFPKEIYSAITSVRCECLIHKDDWDKHFKGDANPRNSAAGTLRKHSGKNAMYLQFYAFDALLDLDIFEHDAIDEEADCSEHEMLDVLSQWFRTPDYYSSSNIEELVTWYEKAEKRRDSLKYEVDGVVAKIDDREVSQTMGGRDGRPKGQIAIKFAPRGGETVLRKVVWQVGHTGALTPVGKVDPVVVGGTTIRRVTLCNLDEIRRLNIAIGDTVEIIRAGDVIPKLSKRVRQNESGKIIYPPKNCPECDCTIIKDGARIFCPNRDCNGQILGRVMTWIKKRNILNLGIGVVRAAKIHFIYDLYTMVEDDWADIQVKNGVLGLKRATKIMEALEKSKTVSLPEFLGSLGIKGVGRSLATDLCEHFSGLPDSQLTLNDIFWVLDTDVEKCKGFGLARASDFCNWLRQYRDEVVELSNLLNIQYETNKTSGSFDGETICFTGKSPKPRIEMSKLAEAAGASVSSSVNSNTTILVIADTNSTSSKAIKARKLGIRLVSPDEFLSQV